MSPLYTVAHEGVTEFNRSKEAGNSEDVVVDGIQRGVGIAAEGLHGLAQVPGVVETVHAVGGLFERIQLGLDVP